MSEIRSCLFCKHLYWNAGEHSYSELTPGYSSFAECKNAHFSYYLIQREDVAEMLSWPERCGNYEREVQDE